MGQVERGLRYQEAVQRICGKLRLEREAPGNTTVSRIAKRD